MSLDRGALVIVRVRDKPLVRRVWEATGDAVWIHNEEQYQRRVGGQPYISPIVFLRSNVFVHQELPEGVEGVAQGEEFWAGLRGY